MVARRLLLALVLLAAGAPPVMAGASPAAESGGLADDGWVGLAFEGTDGSGQASLEVFGARPVSVGLLLLSGHEHPVGPSAFVFPDGSPGERLRIQQGPVDVDIDQRRGSGTIALQATWSWGLFHDDVTVLAWVGGDVSEASYTVDPGGSEAVLVDQTEGTGSFLLLDGDLGSGAEWHNPPFPARATVVDHPRTIEHSLVGFFDHGNAAIDVMSASTPDGTRSCPCGFAGSSSGEYRFQASGAGVGTNGSVVLAGADARLPAPAR